METDPRAVSHGAVPARIENGIEMFRFHIRQSDRVRERVLCRRIRLKTGLGGRLIFRPIALWINRRLPSLRLGESQLDAGVPENEVGAAPSSSQKPVLTPVLPSWSCHVNTISIFICFLLCSRTGGLSLRALVSVCPRL
jgi:hypothetical protein